MSVVPINSPERLKVGGNAYLVELEDPADFQSDLVVRRVTVDGILRSAFVVDEENDVTMVEEVAVVSSSLEPLANGTRGDIKPTSMLFTADALHEVVAQAEDLEKPDLKKYSSLSGVLRNKKINMRVASYLVIAEFQRELKQLPVLKDIGEIPQPKPAEEM